MTDIIFTDHRDKRGHRFTTGHSKEVSVLIYRRLYRPELLAAVIWRTRTAPLPGGPMRPAPDLPVQSIPGGTATNRSGDKPRKPRRCECGRALRPGTSVGRQPDLCPACRLAWGQRQSEFFAFCRSLTSPLPSLPRYQRRSTRIVSAR